MDTIARLVIDGRDVAPVAVARRYHERRRGLLGTDGIDGALWIEPCKQVHTIRMRYPIDIAHVARDGLVLATRTMPPWRFSALRVRARSVVEAEAGSFERWGLAEGSRVAVREPGGAVDRSA